MYLCRDLLYQVIEDILNGYSTCLVKCVCMRIGTVPSGSILDRLAVFVPLAICSTNFLLACLTGGTSDGDDTEELVSIIKIKIGFSFVYT